MNHALRPFMSSTPVGLNQLLAPDTRNAQPTLFTGSMQWPSLHGGNRTADNRRDPVRDMLNVPAGGKPAMDLGGLMSELVDKLTALLNILTGRTEPLENIFRGADAGAPPEAMMPTAQPDPLSALLGLPAAENPFALGLEDFARMRIEDDNQSGII
ncbi:MAG: hypothetical protein AB7P76_08850 [Candidatus Melainabacteria bacterium]